MSTRVQIVANGREIIMDFGNGTIAATFTEDHTHMALTIEDPNEGEMMGRLLTRSEALDLGSALVKLAGYDHVR